MRLKRKIVEHQEIQLRAGACYHNLEEAHFILAENIFEMTRGLLDRKSQECRFLCCKNVLLFLTPGDTGLFIGNQLHLRSSWF